MQGRALAVPAGRNAELPLEGSRKRGVGLIADAIGGFAEAQALVTQESGRPRASASAQRRIR